VVALRLENIITKPGLMGTQASFLTCFLFRGEQYHLNEAYGRISRDFSTLQLLSNQGWEIQNQSNWCQTQALPSWANYIMPVCSSIKRV
jgi:hypothetical protein